MQHDEGRPTPAVAIQPLEQNELWVDEDERGDDWQLCALLDPQQRSVKVEWQWWRDPVLTSPTGARGLLWFRIGGCELGIPTGEAVTALLDAWQPVLVRICDGSTTTGWEETRFVELDADAELAAHQLDEALGNRSWGDEDGPQFVHAVTMDAWLEMMTERDIDQVVLVGVTEMITEFGYLASKAGLHICGNTEQKEREVMYYLSSH